MQIGSRYMLSLRPAATASEAQVVGMRIGDDQQIKLRQCFH